MAVQGSTCGRTKIDLNQMFQSINNEETRARATGKTSHYMTQDELSIINAELAKLLTPPQTKHAMRILQGFRENATDNEKDAALVSFIRREDVSLLMHRLTSNQFILNNSLFQLDLFKSAILSLRATCTAN